MQEYDLNKGKKEICSINYLRLLCAFLVVAIHTHPFEDINRTLGFIATSIIPRIAVPFFFVVSGYFYIQALEKGKRPFMKYTKSLFHTYVIWSMIYFVINFFDTVTTGMFSIKGYIADCVVRFVWFGAFYHFWYFPALFICIVIVTFFYKIKKMKMLCVTSLMLYVIGVLGCAYYQIAINIPGISKIITYAEFEQIRRIFMMGLPFFVMGYFILKIKWNREKSVVLMSMINLALFLGEIILVINFDLQKNIVLTFFLYPLVFFVFLLCLEYPMHSEKQYSELSRKISGFIYYIHPLVIYVLRMLGNISPTVLFFITCVLSSILGVVVLKMNNKLLNKLL